MNRHILHRSFIASVCSLAILLTGIIPNAPIASAQEIEFPTMTLAPGEEGEYLIYVPAAPIGTADGMGAVLFYKVTGMNLNPNSPPGQQTHDGSCYEKVEAWGYFGNRLWMWETRQLFRYDGDTVWLGSVEQTPTTYHSYWQFDGSFYDEAGSGTFIAIIDSIGNWRSCCYGGKAGKIRMEMHPEGYCEVDTEIRDR